jgi:acyl-CoA reductase-like NAD-dependent aldehyde dehydrogenase
MSKFIDEKLLQEDIQRLEFLARLLEKNRLKIVQLAAEATQTSPDFHQQDIDFVVLSLKNMLLPSKREHCLIRSKGRVLMGLSANEPIIVGLIPVAYSLFTQNQTSIKASSRNKMFQELILSLFNEAGFDNHRLESIDITKENFSSKISCFDYVFWFGSYKTCKHIAIECIQAGVSYDLESEGDDIAIIEENVFEEKLESILETLFKSSARHKGQTCQAIRGIYIPEKYKSIAVDLVNGLTNKFPVEVDYTCSPNFLQVPFDSRLWIKFYAYQEELSELVNNPYRLSLSVFSNRNEEEVLKSFSFYSCARLIVNSNPSEVELNEPWGGLGFSGTTGIASWADKFTDVTYLKYNANF